MFVSIRYCDYQAQHKHIYTSLGTRLDVFVSRRVHDNMTHMWNAEKHLNSPTKPPLAERALLNLGAATKS